MSVLSVVVSIVAIIIGVLIVNQLISKDSGESKMKRFYDACCRRFN